MDCQRVSKPNTNKTTDRGLWQLNSQYHLYITDCYDNTDKAYEIYVKRGHNFSAWAAYNSGAYKKFYN